MEELQPQDIEEVLQELEENHSQESLPQEVEELLHVLQSGSLYLARQDAAEQLGNVDRSSARIVRALIAACESDHSQVRRAAARSLRASVHQPYLQQHPDLREAAERVLEQTLGSELVTRPAHLQVGTQGNTLCISWKPEAEQRKDAVKNPLWVLLVSALLLFIAISMSPSQLRIVWILVLCLATLGAAYWIAAVLTSSTKIVAGKGEWILQRGPLPIPKEQFYIRPERLDPDACRWIWIDRVEEYKLKMDRSSGSSGSADGPLGCLFALLEIGVLLSSIRRELVVSHTLYARRADGGDQELLCLLSKREAEYLRHSLQKKLDAGAGLLAQE